MDAHIEKSFGRFFFFCKIGVKFSLRQPRFLSNNNNKKMEYDISVQVIKKALIYANL